MEGWWQFFTFSDPNVRFVTIGAMLITASAAVVGTYTFLRKRALLGDAIGHSILPGVALGFLVSGTKNPLWIALGAFIAGWLSILSIDFIARRSRIKEDTAIALVLSVFFGFGIVLLTYIQSTGSGAQSGLDQFLFGKAAALVGRDLWVFTVLAVMILATCILFYKEFELISFNREFAMVQGMPVQKLDFLLSSLTVLAIVAGIQAVGVVLIAAMLVTPPAAARFWTHKLKFLMLLSALFGAFSGLMGAFVSYTAPGMPTGPWIVLVASTIAAFSFLLGTDKGILHKVTRNKQITLRIDEEHVLKSLFLLQERGHPLAVSPLLDNLDMSGKRLQRTLNRLSKKGWIDIKGWNLEPTPLGWEQAARVVRLHRLWELYLTKVMNRSPEHVHEEAEAIEHIINEETEIKLEKALGFPDLDPHQSKIPR
jgi:manganese/zinc/iron transport system permease protein